MHHLKMTCQARPITSPAPRCRLRQDLRLGFILCLFYIYSPASNILRPVLYTKTWVAPSASAREFITNISSDPQREKVKNEAGGHSTPMSLNRQCKNRSAGAAAVYAPPQAGQDCLTPNRLSDRLASCGALRTMRFPPHGSAKLSHRRADAGFYYSRASL